MNLGPVVVREMPDGPSKRPVCLEVWLASRRMARKCLESSRGTVFFHRIRLESRRSLPVAIRVVIPSEFRNEGEAGMVRAPTGRDDVLAQMLPDLVASYAEEPAGQDSIRPSPTDATGPFGDAATCRMVVGWPQTPDSVRLSCGGWTFEVHRAPTPTR